MFTHSNITFKSTINYQYTTFLASKNEKNIVFSLISSEFLADIWYLPNENADRSSTHYPIDRSLCWNEFI